MVDLGDILARKLDQAGPVPSSAPMAAAELRSHYKSNRAMARDLGVDEKSVRRWLAGGTTPKSATADRIVQSLRSARVDLERVKSGLPIKFKYDGRERSIPFKERQPGTRSGGTNTLKPGTAEKMAAAYAKGDKEGLARAFIAGVDEGFYADTFEAAYEADGPSDGVGSDSVAVFVG